MISAPKGKPKGNNHTSMAASATDSINHMLSYALVAGN